MKRSCSLSLLLALAVPAVPAVAWAQAATFALNRYNPSERGSDWFVNESLDLRGHLRPFLGLVGDWSYKPLVLYDTNGDEVESIVRHQVYAHVGGGVILWERVRAAASLPVLIYNRGASAAVADGTYTGAGNKDLDYKGKAITVISENGPEITIIDCEGEGRGFWFHTNEGENSVLSGFTITLPL